MIDNYHNRMNIQAMQLPDNLDYNNNYNLYQGNPIYMYYMFPHYYRAHLHNRQQGVAHSTVVGHNMGRNTERSMERSMERNTVVGHNTGVVGHNTVVEGRNTHNMAHNKHNMGHNMERSMEHNNLLRHIIDAVEQYPLYFAILTFYNIP